MYEGWLEFNGAFNTIKSYRIFMAELCYINIKI